MLYALKMGNKERSLIQQSLRFNRPLPDEIKNAPYLEQGLNLYYCGFFDLDSERAITMGGVGCIPFTAILSYCKLYEFDDETTEDFIFMIRKMDSEYVKFQNAKTTK